MLSQPISLLMLETARLAPGPVASVEWLTRVFEAATSVSACSVEEDWDSRLGGGPAATGGRAPESAGGPRSRSG